jgi:hypothetical protein
MSILQTEINLSKNRFYNWSLRIIDEKINMNLSISFGITTNEMDPISYIQIVEVEKGTSTFYKYDYNDFSVSYDTIFIGENYISDEGIYIKTSDFEINLAIDSEFAIRKSFFKPRLIWRIKRIYNNMKTDIIFSKINYKGQMIYQNKTEYINGTGSILKNYGSNYPKEFIMITGNHFNKEMSIYFMMTLTKLRKQKIRTYSALLRHNGKEYWFKSSFFTRVKIKAIGKTQLTIRIKRNRYKLIFNINTLDSVKIKIPNINANINRDLEKSLNSIGTITLYKSNKIIFDTLGRNIELENTYDI